MTFELENGLISGLQFKNGCPGNLQGISRLVEGRPALEVAEAISDIKCGNKQTSCPAQLSIAIRQAVAKSEKKSSSGKLPKNRQLRLETGKNPEGKNLEKKKPERKNREKKNKVDHADEKEASSKLSAKSSGQSSEAGQSLEAKQSLEPKQSFEAKIVSSAVEALDHTPDSQSSSQITHQGAWASFDTPLGPMIATAVDGAVVSLNFSSPQSLKSEPTSGLQEPFKTLQEWLARYFAGRQPRTFPKIKPHGTHFQRIVWDLLRHIPYGKICSYSFLAEAVRKLLGTSAMAAQAVGGAVGRNPIAVVIPCHRVVGKDGSLVGYASGLNIKGELLRREGHENDGQRLTGKIVLMGN
jgi:methylated-DNA-[protein]-cysteine S-methyltransferase